ncbi:hypothetical protein ACIHFD_49655 [Nonomuraea sp. NPDC051941]|uniref:hypothetical protein n=1 Tax=Nonomuraea sp. NPDC051941 TaxID=3364373 RepID=UPI0037CB1FB1
MPESTPPASPGVGARRAADILNAAFPDLTVGRNTVIELARQGLIAEAGTYKGHQLYDEAAIAGFTDRAALERAFHNGGLRTSDEAAAYLRVRRSDFDHLVHAQWLEPSGWAYGPYQRRRDSPCVALYRTGDLDVLLGHPGIDWDQVRATPAGRPSALATLTRKAAR